MSQPRAFYRSGTLTIDGSATAYLDNSSALSGTTTNTVIQCNGYWDYAVVQCISTSLLAFKVYVSYNNGTTFEPANLFDAAGAGTAADSAFTPSAGDVIRFMIAGATHLRITETAGSGTVTVFASSGFPEVNVIGMGTLSALSKAEDAAHASGDTGVMALTVRQDSATALAGTDADYQPPITDNLGRLHTTNVSQDATIGVTKVEERFNSSGAVLATTTIKSGVGFLHSVTLAQADAAPTAGTITIYDGTSAAGTKLFEWNLTTAVFNPFTVILDVSFAIGLHLVWATTADVNAFVSYR